MNRLIPILLYVDPATGGTLFQILFLAFSAVVAALVFLRNKIEGLASAVSGFIRNLLGHKP